jgi:hypothetical protein
MSSYGILSFDLKQGTGNYTVVFDNGGCSRGGGSCKTISSDAYVYYPPQETADADFFTFDFCFGRTDRVDQAILDGAPMDLSKKLFGKSPF